MFNRKNEQLIFTPESNDTISAPSIEAYFESAIVQTNFALEHQLGELGTDLRKNINRVKVKETLEKDDPELSNCHAGFDYRTNHISYTPISLRQNKIDNSENLTLFFQTRIHEITHALQYDINRAYCMDTDPTQNIILSPLSFLKACNLQEDDAEVKGTVISSIRSRMLKEIGRFDLDKLTPNSEFLKEYFEKIYSDVKQDRRTEEKINFWLVKHSSVDSYNKRSLREYFQKSLYAKINGLTPIIARISDSDIQSIGDSFGPNLFCDENGEILEKAREPLNLRFSQRAMVNTLERLWRIEDEASLPTTDEVLGRNQP